MAFTLSFQKASISVGPYDFIVRFQVRLDDQCAGGYARRCGEKSGDLFGCEVRVPEHVLYMALFQDPDDFIELPRSVEVVEQTTVAVSDSWWQTGNST